MTKHKTIAIATALAVGLFAAAVGSPIFIIPFVFVVIVVALLSVFAYTSERPIASDPAYEARWYRWIIAGAAMFAIGMVTAIIDGPEFSSAGWAIWFLSWTFAAVLVLFGIVFAATKALHRST